MLREPPEPIDFRQALGRPLRVRWEGDQSLLSSLALVNREFCLALLGSGDVELEIRERRGPWHRLTEREDPRFGPLFACRERPLSGPPDVTVRHFFPPDWRPPEAGKLVVMQPWEYGHLPREWVSGAAHGADEVWAYSRFVRDIYARSGVPAEKVRVVPLGFNPDVFAPDGPTFDLPSRHSHASTPPHSHTPTRFLFVGGALDRKGADLLLAAYREAFTRDDPVSLVVKDMGTRTFYRGAGFEQELRRAAADPNGPELLYLDSDLSDRELASLYRACTCLVLPYRGEGFGLPPLEAMACGRMPIVTAGGPSDDYLNETVAVQLPATKRHRGKRTVGFDDCFECVGDPWQLEPDFGALVAALRWAHESPEEVRRRGAAARELVRETWSWQAAAAVARDRLRALAEPRHAGSNAQHPPPNAQRPTPALGYALGPNAQRLPSAMRRGPTPNACPRLCVGAQPPTPHAYPRPHNHQPSTINHHAAGPSPLTTHEPALSLCMIVRDEEARIAECLRSVAPWVDEMIVVDTGSADRTPEIARECGARVFAYPWTDSFAEARNQSLELARGRWLFWMDADDIIPAECGRELRGIVAHHLREGTEAAYNVAVRIPPGPGEYSPSLVDHLKLFPNRPDLRFEHRIHEQILSAVRAARLPVCFAELWVEHRNYDRSPDGQAKKRRRDFRLLELDLRDRPDHPFVLFNLGMTHLHATKEFEVAAHYLRRSLDRSHPSDSIVRKAYAMLTTARMCLDETAEALQANEEGRSHYPDDAELLFQAGQLYQQFGRWEEARRALERLVEGGDEAHYRSVDAGLRTYRGRQELALLFRRLGDGRHCEAVLREICREHPHYLPSQVHLSETVLLLGRRQEALLLLPEAASANGLAQAVSRIRRQAGADARAVPADTRRA